MFFGLINIGVMTTHKIAVEIVELEPNTYHPLIKADFQGLDNYWWVIDSGATKSVFDIMMAESYISEQAEAVMATGLGKEVVETSSGKIISLKLGGHNFGNLNIALVDFSHINLEYAKFTDKKIIGLIGSDFLYSRKAILDYGKGVLKLR
ncbi:MAG: retropepsin-like aspartic protease [Mariniphaga sp.]